MRCPNCQNETKENPCSNCGGNVYEIINPNQNTTNNKTDKSEDIIEPEIVSENEYSRSKTWQNGNSYSSYSQTSGGSFRQYTFINPQFNMRSSCLPSVVSLVLFIMVILEYGFLAAIGFGFFLLIGKAIALFVIVKNLVNGKFVPPILLDCAVWIISYYLVYWLAD